jgi:hypothetical protein
VYLHRCMHGRSIYIYLAVDKIDSMHLHAYVYNFSRTIS